MYIKKLQNYSKEHVFYFKSDPPGCGNKEEVNHLKFCAILIFTRNMFSQS
jgi:hypothetical protein